MRRRGIHMLFPVIVLGLLMLSWTAAQATHIVGGELNYSNLGNNNYRVELKLYKDCGISIVPFDDPATIYVYGSDDVFITSFEIPIVERDTLNSALLDPCLLVPPDVCVDFARYELTVNLPAIPEDYTLAYIRCCRNSTILNAEGEDAFGNPLPPDLIGATYSARIPASPTVNSNPEFNELPPIILCAGQDIAVDQSASDADGDDLVYALCTPNVGGSLVNVFGDPLTERPPFEQVIWVEPYGLDNILGGDLPLEIDPQTGMLTGSAPFTIGQFVVGVCVREFRNGVLLSENKRDFQFNVAECSDAITSEFDLDAAPYMDTVILGQPDPYFDYVLLCDEDLIVQFNNLSEGSDTVVWDFGDGASAVLVDDPIHEYADTGLYLVSLVAGPGNQCADTFRQLINVQYQNSFAGIDPGNPMCYDPAEGLQFTDASAGSGEIASWHWDFGDGATSTAQHPVHSYNSDGSYLVELEIVEKNGCRTWADTVISVESLDPFSLPDTLSLCGGDTVRLQLAIEGEHIFEWSPAGSLSETGVAEPLAFPDVNTIYTVDILTVRESGDTCRQQGRVAVLVDGGVPEITDLTDPLACEADVSLAVEASQGASVLWALDPLFLNVVGQGEAVTVSQPQGSQVYYVKASAYNCTAVDTVLVEQRRITIEGDDQLVCRGERTAVRPEVVSADMDIIYTWSPEGGEIDNTIPEYVFYPTVPVTVTLEAVNATGCTAAADFEIGIAALPELNAVATPSQIAVPQVVQFQATDPPGSYQYAWEPAGAFNDPSLNGPTAFVDSTIDFVVTVTDGMGCPHRDTVRVILLEPCDERNIFLPNAFSPNGDGLNDVFRLRTAIAEYAELTIVDRWGNVVYASDDPLAGWDGTSGGSPVKGDVYAYVLRVVCIGGETYHKNGNITLLR